MNLTGPVALVKRSRRGGRVIVHDMLGDLGMTRCGLDAKAAVPTAELVDCPRCLPPGQRPPEGHVDRQRARYTRLAAGS